MIKFENDSEEIPFKIFRQEYEIALKKNQNAIDAFCISSYCIKSKEVNSRFVNLKIVDSNKLVFFSNYLSPKSVQFNGHNKISALIYWNQTNCQIRMKGQIYKTSKEFNQKYFEKRSKGKNALAISSNQSNVISSFEDVKLKYLKVKKNNDLTKCPEYWGGFAFIPNYFEFWKGSDLRLNLRNQYVFNKDQWLHSILEP